MEFPPNLPIVILAIVGGDPKSEFRADQITSDIAAAKPGRPLIYAAQKTHETSGTQWVPGTMGDGGAFSGWGWLTPNLENPMGNQNDQSGQKNQQQKHQNQPQSGQQKDQQQRQGGQQGGQQGQPGQQDRDQQINKPSDQQNKQR